MTTIVGLDPSLRSFGIATVATDGVRWTVETRSVFSSGSGDDSLAERAHRLRNIGFDVTIATDNADLVVIEGPALGVQTPYVWDRAGLWWHIVNRVTRDNVPMIEVPPTTVKKFATGKGRADKQDVFENAQHMWLDWEPTFKTLRRYDEADALVLASIGCVLDGLHPPFAMTNFRREAIAKIQPPEEYAA